MKSTKSFIKEYALILNDPTLAIIVMVHEIKQGISLSVTETPSQCILIHLIYYYVLVIDFLPTRSLKSRPTSPNIAACSLALFMHALYVSEDESTLLSCLSSNALNPSTCILAHLTHALSMLTGKQAWKITAVCLIMEK